MQKYSCKICGQEAKHGFTKVHEGVFFKLCQECFEDEAAISLLNEGLKKHYDAKEDNVE